jgi:methylamine utilization protein MauE
VARRVSAAPEANPRLGHCHASTRERPYYHRLAMSLTFVPLAAAGLGLVFIWAAVAKPLRWAQWKEALDGYGWRSPVAVVTAFTVPVLEAAAGLALLAGPRRAGAALTLALLAGSSFAVARLGANTGGRVPCGCFGRTVDRDARLVLGRNAFLGVIAGAVLIIGRTESTMWRAPSGSEVFPAALVLAGLTLAAWTLWRASAALKGKPHG